MNRGRAMWEMIMVKRAAVLVLLAGAVGGCGVDGAGAVRSVDESVFARAGHHVRWERGEKEPEEVRREVEKMLGKPLGVEEAVEVALLRNAGVQAKLEEVGVSQSELVQTGLLKNPTFAGSWRFGSGGG